MAGQKQAILHSLVIILRIKFAVLEHIRVSFEKKAKNVDTILIVTHATVHAESDTLFVVRLRAIFESFFGRNCK